MKIAIAGASDLVKKIHDVLSEEEGLDLVTYEADRIVDVVEKSKNMDDDVDGIIFTGVGVYNLAVNTHNYGKPIVYTNRNITSITETFYKIYSSNFDLSNLRIGIDTVNEVDLLDFIREFDVSIKNYKLQEYIYPKREEDFIATYLEQYKSGEIECILTASRYIYQYFQDRDIPVYRLMPSNSEIRSTFQELKNEIEKHNLSDKVALVQVFEIKENEGFIASKEDKSNLKDLLKIYAKEIEGMIRIIDENEFMVLSSKKTAENKENLKALYNVIQDAERLGIKLAVGIGEGETLYQSEDNARNAVRRSKLDKGSSIFSYDGEKVIGPMFSKNEMEYSTESNKDYEKLVEEIGISYQYIEKIDSVKRKLGRDDFTSKELAELLLISERTANRLLKKVIESGYGEEIGKEVSLGVGRPRRKIEILF